MGPRQRSILLLIATTKVQVVLIIAGVYINFLHERDVDSTVTELEKGPEHP